MPTEPVPRSVRPAFQEYELERLNVDRDAALIIERVLALGGRAEFGWLFGHYGRARITDWVKEMGHRRLPWRRYSLWCVLLDLPRQPRRTPLWPH